MTSPEPTAEARAAAWKLHEAWHHHFYGQYTIEACPACLEIALTLDAFRAQGVEQAEKENKRLQEFIQLYDSPAADQRIASLEAELVRVREGRAQELACHDCREYRALLVSRLEGKP